ncbi:hypothetical protein GN156_28645, partial [bacterium LRH843]|nr:hypothetical protein [bacterium LRH843]
TSSNSDAKPASSTTTSNGLDDATLKAVMLDLATQKTGPESDMIAFDQNLEADLGVDSIKRVDIVSGVLDKLPENITAAITDEKRSSLSTAS